MEWKEPPNMEWIDSPPRKGGGRPPGKWAKVTAELKANPNRWAFIGTTNHRATAYIIGNKYGVRIVVRANKSGTYDMYGIAEKERKEN